MACRRLRSHLLRDHVCIFGSGQSTCLIKRRLRTEVKLFFSQGDSSVYRQMCVSSSKPTASLGLCPVGDGLPLSRFCRQPTLARLLLIHILQPWNAVLITETPSGTTIMPPAGQGGVKTVSLTASIVDQILLSAEGKTVVAKALGVNGGSPWAYPDL